MSNKYSIVGNGVVYTPNQVYDDGVVVFENEKIVWVGLKKNFPRIYGKPKETIDAGGNLIIPGLIDQHLHGGGGADTMDMSYDAINTIAKAHAQFGVVALCPATMAAPQNDFTRALSAVADAVERGTNGAKVLGSYIEGPAMNPAARGAHPDEYVKNAPPSLEMLKAFHQAARGTIKVWTVAPELPGAIEFIKAATKLGIIVSIGHTKAGVADVEDAIEAGATNVTHLYNAMSGFHYRDAGGVMEILAEGENLPLMVEIVADGEHVHPKAIKVAKKCVGMEKLVLMTDCMRPAGLSSMTSFDLPGLKVYVKDGRAVTAEGKLCGSLLTMNRAVKNFSEMLGIPLPDALTLATINPAKALGIADKKGSLEVGKDADIVICDTFLNVKRTIVEGTTVYM